MNVSQFCEKENQIALFQPTRPYFRSSDLYVIYFIYFNNVHTLFVIFSIWFDPQKIPTWNTKLNWRPRFRDKNTWNLSRNKSVNLEMTKLEWFGFFIIIFSSSFSYCIVRLPYGIQVLTIPLLWLKNEYDPIFFLRKIKWNWSHLIKL